MKGLLKILLIVIALISLAIHQLAYSAIVYTPPDISTANPNANQNNPQSIAWVSQSGDDVISFPNGTGATLVIQITVSSNANKTGVNVTNCGTTTHIGSGSTATCVTRDASNPVSFVTDNAAKSVSGYYVVQLLRNF